MIYGDMPVEDAVDAILAHSVRSDGVLLKKGRILSKEDVEKLRNSGISSVVAARLEETDIGEDIAAARIAGAVTGENLSVSAAFTGRVNLYAAADGVLVYDREIVNSINLVDEAATIALLPPYTRVATRQLIATVKIIPFAVPEEVVAECEKRARQNPLKVAAFTPRSVSLIQTRLPGTKESVLDKTVQVVRNRVAGLGGTLINEARCNHSTDEIRASIEAQLANGSDFVLIIGASAITDRRDVVPSAIVAAEGIVDHFGMPVDPGNLLLLGHIGSHPIVGLPGCARSPKLNGFDWVLDRLFADIPVGREDVMAMGIGGLLKEIPARPLPRSEATDMDRSEDAGSGIASAPRVAAVVLAAGQSRRMGDLNKLLAEIDGKAMVRRVVDTVRQADVDSIIVVTGHEAEKVRKAIGDQGVSFVHNPNYAEGLSTSLSCGISALEKNTDAAIVCLGDMPRVTASTIDRLIASFDPVEGRAICVPTYNGKRGNPMIFSSQFFEEVLDISGDLGARQLTGTYPELTCEVEMADDEVLLDIDTPSALARFTAS